MLHGQDLNQKCPCGSHKPFSFCCEPAILGHKPALTAQALMRSRYTAFSLGCVDYLISTTATKYRNPDDAELISEQMQVTTWIGLEILSNENGEADDQQGIVEFVAGFEADGEQAQLHERSRFIKEDGLWMYVDGDVEVRG